MKSFVLLPLVAAVSLSAMADTNIDETMVVTATKTSQPLYKTMASVSVLSASDIAKSQAISLGDLLGTLPGIDSSVSGGRGGQVSLNVRGTESDHVLILVDGVRMSSATQGQVTLSSVPLSQIERIEVVRGPRSSLYGAEAIGGVIQIFTKKGGEQRSYVTTELGSHNRTLVTAGTRGSVGATQYSADVSHENTDGYDATITRNTVDDDKDGFRNRSVSLAADHTFENQLNVAFNYLYSEADVEADLGGYPPSSAGELIKINDNRKVTVSMPVTSDLTAVASVSRFSDKQETLVIYPSTYETQRDSKTLQLDYTLSENQNVTVGYEGFKDSVTSGLDYKINSNENDALFLQYQGQFDQILFSASVRQEDNEAFSKHYTRSFSAGYQISEQTLVSLAFGTGFKAPTFNDLYYPDSYYVDGWGPGVDYAYQSNEALKPETSESWELMLRSRVGEVDLSVSVYDSKIENLIELGRVVTPTLVADVIDNVAQASIRGAEAELAFELLQWDIKTALSYVDPINEGTDAMLQNRSRDKVDLEASKLFGDILYAVAWQAQGHRFDPSGNRFGGYNTVDLRAKYAFNESLEIKAQLKNAFDKDYQQSVSFETEGRTVSVGATYSF